MKEMIGQDAGKVWEHLSDNGATKLNQLPKGVGISQLRVERALGWLAREDKIRFETKGKAVFVSIVVANPG